jgi:hypothetical protein
VNRGKIYNHEKLLFVGFRLQHGFVMINGKSDGSRDKSSHDMQLLDESKVREGCPARALERIAFTLSDA